MLAVAVCLTHRVGCYNQLQCDHKLVERLRRLRGQQLGHHGNNGDDSNVWRRECELFCVWWQYGRRLVVLFALGSFNDKCGYVSNSDIVRDRHDVCNNNQRHHNYRGVQRLPRLVVLTHQVPHQVPHQVADKVAYKVAYKAFEWE